MRVCEMKMLAIFRSDRYRPVHDRSICPASFFIRGTALHDSLSEAPAFRISDGSISRIQFSAPPSIAGLTPER